MDQDDPGAQLRQALGAAGQVGVVLELIPHDLLGFPAVGADDHGLTPETGPQAGTECVERRRNRRRVEVAQHRRVDVLRDLPRQ